MSQICYRVTNLLLYYRNGVIEYRTGRAYTPGELDRRIHSPHKRRDGRVYISHDISPGGAGRAHRRRGGSRDVGGRVIRRYVHFIKYTHTVISLNTPTPCPFFEVGSFDVGAVGGTSKPILLHDGAEEGFKPHAHRLLLVYAHILL